MGDDTGAGPPVGQPHSVPSPEASTTTQPIITPSSECGRAPPSELREFMDPRVVDALDRGICTFVVKQRLPIRQNYVTCNTCWPGDDSTCVCLSCAAKCHSGHDLGPIDGPG